MKTFLLTAAAALLAAPAFSDTVEVRMMNKGPEGARMVFDPAFVQLEPGDTLRIVSASRGHSAATIDGMIPEGAAAFKGQTGKDIEVTLEAEGWYGIKCLPHYSMGMVMAVRVGSADLPAGFLEAGLPKAARQRMLAAVALAE